MRSIIMFGLVGLINLPCFAQTGPSSPENKPPAQQTVESAPKTFYQLTFALRELESERVIKTRSYSMIMFGPERSSIRAGEKVPFSSTSGTNTNWEQIDVGVNIDCRKLEVAGNKASLEVKAEISSVMENSKADRPPASLPIIRNNQWESQVIVPIKQPVVLFSSDDPASKRTMQLQLMVTPIK